MPDVAPAKGRRKRGGPKPTTPVQIPGPFLDRVSKIPTGSATLVTTLGEADGQRYLVPFLDVSFIERPDDAGPEDETEVFASLIQLDNAAFLFMVLGAELAESLKDFEAMTASGAAPGEPSMLAAIKETLPTLRDSLEAMSATLDRLAAGSEKREGA